MWAFECGMAWGVVLLEREVLLSWKLDMAERSVVA